MSECSTNQPENFSRLVSSLDDEAWNFSIQFTPYKKVIVALNNLDVVHAAMLEAVLALSAAKAGMENSVEFDGFGSDVYAREQSKATSSLLNFSALYASYIDVCRRVRKYSGRLNDKAYRHAIHRLIGENSGAHDFIKGLRNFILHYHLPQPGIQITSGKVRSVDLYLESSSLLFSGFDWTSDARSYLQREARLDIHNAVTVVMGDIDRLVKFHRKLSEKGMQREKFAYDVYTYERVRLKHLQNSVVDLNAAFLKRPTTTISRLISKDLVEQVLNSLLPDDEVRMVLSSLADRHKNLSFDARRSVTREIEKLLKERARFNNTGTYLQGRALK